MCQDVVQRLQQAAHLCNARYVSAAANRMAKLHERQQAKGVSNREAFQQLAQLASGLELDAWAVAQTIWAADKLWDGVHPKQPFGAERAAWQRRLAEALGGAACKPQSVSNGLLGASKLGWQLEDGLAAAADAAMQRTAARMDSQEVSNTLWAFVNAGWQLDSGAAEALLQQLEQVLSQAVPQAVSNSLWAVPKLGLRLSGGLQAAFEAAIQRTAAEMNSQDVANSLWAIAKLGLQLSGGLQAAFAPAVQRIIPDAKPQELANMLWACGTLRWSPGDATLAAAVATMQQLLASGVHKPQELNNFLWGLAELQEAGTKLPSSVRTLCTAAVDWAGGRWGQLPALDVVDLCYNLARLGQRPSGAWIGAATER